MDVPPAAPARVWLGEQSRGSTQLQPRLRAELAGITAEDGVELGTAGIDRAVTLWNGLFRSIEYSGGHHTALKLLNGTLAYHSIPELPPYDPAWLAPLADAPMWQARSWLIYPPTGADMVLWADRQSFTGWDVNGMYLSAADRPLGTGAPDRLDWPSTAVLRLPGYVRVSSLEDAPWGILGQWDEGSWMPTPMAEYLHDAGAQFLIVEALIWPKSRHWLGPHVGMLRRARESLMACGPDDVAARVLLDIVKDIYTRMFGGLLRSGPDVGNYNQGATMNPAWADMLPATGQARLFRALDKTPGRLVGSPVYVAGIHVDAAWFVMPAGYEVPPGLTVSTQLGKFKPTARTAWTPALHAAYVHGDHGALWKALDQAKGSAGGR